MFTRAAQRELSKLSKVEEKQYFFGKGHLVHDEQKYISYGLK